MNTCAPEPATLRLRVAAGVQGVSAAQRAVQGLSAGHGLSARTTYRLELVLEELLVNADVHGRAQAIDVAITLRPGDVVVQLHDDGQPFDPGSVPPATNAASPDPAQIGGRGLLLVRKSVREWTYHRAQDGNLQRLVLARDP